MSKCLHKWVYDEDLRYLESKEATLDILEIWVRCKKCGERAEEIYDYHTRLNSMGKEI